MSYKTMQCSEANTLLSQDVEALCHELFPHGKVKSGEFLVGSIDGEEGESLKVCLKPGKNHGIWTDFATGDCGNMFNLFKTVNGLNANEACAEVSKRYGVEQPKGLREQFRKSYQPPVKPQSSTHGEGIDWLIKTRRLTTETVKAFRIGCKGPTLHFPFFHGDELVMVKSRDSQSKKTMPTSKDQKPVLFGWQALTGHEESITICEGEIDAMSLHQYGVPALSVPFGGGTGNKQAWIENEFERLAHFDAIYLCLDNDPVGLEGAREISSRLGAHRCRIVELPRKDANECLQDGVSTRDILDCFNTAKSQDPEELRSASDYYSEVMDMYYPDEAAVKPVELRLPLGSYRDKLVFRRNELILMNGISGHGKTQFLGHCIVDMMAAGEKVLLASMEMMPKILLGRIGRQSTGCAKPTRGYAREVFNDFDGKLWIYDKLGRANFDRMIEVFEYAYMRYGIKFFAIDSLMMCGIDMENVSSLMDFLHKITDFKLDFDVTVVMVTHARKVLTEHKIPEKADVRGGAEIVNMCDTLIHVWRRLKKEEEMLEGEDGDADILAMSDVVVACDKQRNSGWQGRLNYWFDKDSLQYHASESYRPHQYVKYSELRAVQ